MSIWHGTRFKSYKRVHSEKYVSFPILFSIIQFLSQVATFVHRFCGYIYIYTNQEHCRLPSFQSPRGKKKKNVVKAFCIAIEKVPELRVLLLGALASHNSYLPRGEAWSSNHNLECTVATPWKTSLCSPVVTKPRGPERFTTEFWKHLCSLIHKSCSRCGLNENKCKMCSYASSRHEPSLLSWSWVLRLLSERVNETSSCF